MLRVKLIPLLFAILLAACLSLPAFAQDNGSAPANPDDPKNKEKHECIVTGMPWEESPTRVEAVFSLDGEALRGYFVSLAYMYMLRDTLVADNHTVAILQIKILDYPTFGTDNEQMITVDKFGSNIHLILVDQSIEGTKEPYILAYASENAAREAIDRTNGRFQGEYLPWDKAVQRILEALKVETPELEPSAAMGD